MSLQGCLRVVFGSSTRQRPHRLLRQGQPISPTLITRHTLAEQSRVRAILVAEDNVVNQKLAVRMLDALAINLTWSPMARSGHGLRAESYAAIVMDCQMPTMDGILKPRGSSGARKSDGMRPGRALHPHCVDGECAAW